jgi:glycosyltransferase involved in cell wall biosynthesis
MGRVVHVINHLGWGGAENLVRGMAWHLQSRGWEVTVCALSEPVYEPGSAEVRCLGARGVWDFAAWRRLRRMLRELRPDVVHLHLLWAELWGAPAARAAGARVVITGHCTHDARATSGIARLCSRFAVRGASATIAISAPVAEYRVARCGDALARVQVIHNGVETRGCAAPGRRDAARARLGLPKQGPVVGSVARLHWVKSLDTFLGAAALLARRHQQVRFLIAGGGPQERELRTLASRLGLDGRVLFTGELCLARVREALAAMDIFVLPSVREGLGIAAIEAMAAGLAVVASDCEGIAEVVEPGRSGLLFTPGDVRALAGQVDGLLRWPEHARRLGSAAQRRAYDEFSLERMVTRVEAVYEAAMRP